MLSRSFRFYAAGVTAAAIVVVAGFAQFVFDRQPRQLIASILGLECVPASLQGADCQSRAVSDVITTCVFVIAQADFPLLLKGWDFERQAVFGSNHDFAADAFGEEFSAS
jgi:hypothetical protein